jgi:hypothetical protein
VWRLGCKNFLPQKGEEEFMKKQTKILKPTKTKGKKKATKKTGKKK